MEIAKTSHKVMVLALLCLLISSSCGVSLPLLQKEKDLFWVLHNTEHLYRHEEVCHLHSEPTKIALVPATQGFFIPPKRWVKARVRHFPNAFTYVASGSCTFEMPPVVRWYCQSCRDAEQRFSR